MQKLFLFLLLSIPVAAFSQTAKENKQTIRKLNQRIAVNPQDHQAYLQRSLVKEKMGRKNSARKDRAIAMRLGMKETYDTPTDFEPD
ncbi:MAG: hypothetical protein H7Y27_05980 [Gemmatimonadaceae bacterium]|nr:hypothetical protein [Chitinophagaceae bacterium]